MAGKNVIEFTVSTFKDEALDSKIPVLVDFWAPWCGPCRAIASTITEVADEMVGKAKVGKVNVDEQSELASKYGVMSIPTLIVLKDGKEVERFVGGRPKQFLVDILTKNV